MALSMQLILNSVHIRWSQFPCGCHNKESIEMLLKALSNKQKHLNPAFAENQVTMFA
jgi:hypothetical protein